MSILPGKKPVDVVQRSIIDKLDPYHRTLAEVLAEQGKIIIEGDSA